LSGAAAPHGACTNQKLWELACQRWRPDSRPCSGSMHSIYLWERACSRKRWCRHH